MPKSVLIPLILGLVCFATSLLYRSMPMGDDMQKLKPGMIADMTANGVYSLLLALAAYFMKLSQNVVIYLVVGGMMVISVVTIIPTMMALSKDQKNRGGK